MRLEYFDDACEGRGLLLLYGDSPSEVEALRDAVRRLMVSHTTIEVHDLEFVEAVGNCQLTASSVPTGKGVRRSSSEAFCWELSASEWEEVEALLEPFTNRTAAEAGVRFQYLHEHAGLEVIYSTGRQW